MVQHGALHPLGGGEETAGYKGYGLGMLVELLSAVLPGCADVGPAVQPWTLSRERPNGYGHCFVVLDPKRFTPGFGGRLREYLAAMRCLPGAVRCPGDPEKACEEEARARGVVLHEGTATALKALAGRYGVETPPEFAALDASRSKPSLYAQA